jgi:hypothetical protein
LTVRPALPRTGSAREHRGSTAGAPREAAGEWHRLGAGGIGEIGAGAALNTSLTHLDVSHNAIGARFGVVLASNLLCARNFINVQRTTDNMQRATCNVQRTACSMPHATYNTQRGPCARSLFVNTSREHHGCCNRHFSRCSVATTAVQHSALHPSQVQRVARLARAEWESARRQGRALAHAAAVHTLGQGAQSILGSRAAVQRDGPVPARVVARVTPIARDRCCASAD